jgi:Gpi18-like mannosyltransferase
VTRWRALFAAAVVIALLVGHVLRDTPGYAVRNPDNTVTGDINHYVYWTRLVTLGGIQSAYGGTWPETYAVYPPVTLYAFELIGTAYQRLQDPGFDPDRAQVSLWLHEAIKFVALAWHLLTAGAIFLLVRRLASERAAAIAASLYVVNPAALYDVAHWAQPDGAHSVFSVVAIGLLSLGQVLAPWAAIAAAALAKPQAWSIMPLLIIATLRMHGARGLARGIAAGAVVGVVIVLPFLISGRLREFLALPLVVSSVMPVVSADAHNLWWLLFQPRGLDPLYELDSALAVGPLTYRTAAGLLVAAMAAFACWLYWTRRASLAEAAALSVLSWFTFTTQAHENHLFFALPLLSLAWPTRRSLLVPFAVISLIVLLNMVLHDQLVLEGLGRGLQDPLLVRLRLANAALTVACCLGWSLFAVLRRPDQVVASATVNYWPRHTTRVGLEANG